MKLDDFESKIEGNSDVIKQIKHQFEMINRESTRINKELQDTDYFLNKVQPIATFSQVIMMLR